MKPDWMTCANCFFFDPLPPEERQNSAVPETVELGFCRANPPGHFEMPLSNNWSPFPVIASTDWCGKFRIQ